MKSHNVMNEGYSLRKGNSPYRKRSATPTSHHRGSTPHRQKRKSVSNEQEEIDEIYVATYNDNPKHLYGLDRYSDEEPPKETVYKFNPFAILKQGEKGLGTKRKLLEWVLVTLYIILVLALYEGAGKVFKTDVTNSKPTEDGAADTKIIQRLLEQIDLQKRYLDQVNENVIGFQQYSNCSCNSKVDILLSKEGTQKVFMEKLQQQILGTINVVKTINEKVSRVQLELNQQVIKETNTKKEKELCFSDDCSSSSPNVYSTIQSALDSFYADVLGLPDFALESAGGSVYNSFHSETCDVGAPIIKVFGLPLWQDPRSPRSVIQKDTSPGNCWPMKSNNGYIVIKLAVPIEVTMFTLEHLDRKLDKYSNTMYQLAPREFEVYAWLDKDGNDRIKLGQFAYLRENNAIQTFKSQVELNKPVTLIELRILSNYGNPDCTCLYRFRVHGLSYEWDDLDAEW